MIITQWDNRILNIFDFLGISYQETQFKNQEVLSSIASFLCPIHLNNGHSQFANFYFQKGKNNDFISTRKEKNGVLWKNGCHCFSCGKSYSLNRYLITTQNIEWTLKFRQNRKKNLNAFGEDPHKFFEDLIMDIYSELNKPITEKEALELTLELLLQERPQNASKQKNLTLTYYPRIIYEKHDAHVEQRFKHMYGDIVPF